MPKISVYVKQDLLDRAKASFGNEEVKMSQLVQQGLRQILGGETPVYSARPSDAADLLGPAREALVEHARAEYQDGYRRAAESMPSMPWYVVTDISDADFDIRLWANRWRHSLGIDAANGDVSFPEWLGPMERDLGADLDPIGYDEYSFRRSQPWFDGYGAAMREVWTSLSQPTPSGDEEEEDDS